MLDVLDSNTVARPHTREIGEIVRARMLEDRQTIPTKKETNAV